MSFSFACFTFKQKNFDRWIYSLLLHGRINKTDQYGFDEQKTVIYFGVPSQMFSFYII